MEAKMFSLGQVLSVIHDRLLCDMNDLYTILNFMSGESLYTHQLPRVMREATPVLLRQHPKLSEIDANAVNHDNWRDWLRQQEELYGSELSVLPMSLDEHERIDPISELAEHVHPSKIIARYGHD